MESCEDLPSSSIPVFDLLKHRKKATVVFDHKARRVDELSLKVGDIVEIVSRDCTMTGVEGWWLGRVKGCKNYGLFPFNYVDVLPDH